MRRKFKFFQSLTKLLCLPLIVAYAAQTHAQSSTEYRLGSGDLISIQVFGEEDLTMETKLSDKSTISYPFLGDIAVLDNTITQLESTITNGLKGDYLIEPSQSAPFFVHAGLLCAMAYGGRLARATVL